MTKITEYIKHNKVTSGIIAALAVVMVVAIVPTADDGDAKESVLSMVPAASTTTTTEAPTTTVRVTTTTEAIDPIVVWVMQSTEVIPFLDVVATASDRASQASSVSEMRAACMWALGEIDDPEALGRDIGRAPHELSKLLQTMATEIVTSWGACGDGDFDTALPHLERGTDAMEEANAMILKASR